MLEPVDMNDKEAQLDILAHLDVVPAGTAGTVTEPFEPVVKDGKIYGRGTRVIRDRQLLPSTRCVP